MKDDNGMIFFLIHRDSVPAFIYKSGNATLTGGEIYLDIHPHPADLVAY
ncbi:MAG: hypothetical protein R2847_06080 [Bacteroidia bacterium]